LEEEFKRFQVYAHIIVLFRTRRFSGLMERLGRLKITRPSAWFMLVLFPISAGIALFIFLSDAAVYLSPRGSSVAHVVSVLGPRALLALPGLNPYVPFVYGYLAIVIAVVIHEGAHGVIARNLGLPVKSSGLIFFLIIPIGAFVEVDENALRTARARDSERVLAGGAGVNLVAAVVVLLLLLLLVSSMKPAVNGVAVAAVEDPSPAFSGGLLPGDWIIAVNGSPVNSSGAISSAPWYHPSSVINLTVWRDGKTIEIDDLQLANSTFKTSHGYILGIQSEGAVELRSAVSSYTGALFNDPVEYFCLPTFVGVTFNCADSIPFVGLSPYYVSPIGGSVIPISNLLYWVFFINLNLAIFNALPIYPLDGGQGYFIAVRALGRGKISEAGVMKVTTITAVLLFALVLAVLLYPYLIGVLP